jgi:hypothetical protein
MAESAFYDWDIKQGATETLTITYEADLTGYHVRLHGRETFESTTTVFTATSSPAAGIVFSPGATASTAIITLSSTTTAALAAPLQGVWDVEFYNAASPPVVISPVRGGFNVIPEVTR